MSKKPRRSGKTPATSEATVATPRRRQRPQTKKQIGLSLLQRSKGASIAEMQNAMGWQSHSVRGFLAGTVKKVPGVILASEKPETGPRRYHVEEADRPLPSATFQRRQHRGDAKRHGLAITQRARLSCRHGQEDTRCDPCL